MCEHGIARVIIGSRGADGSLSTRAWNVSACAAEHIANRLGDPDTESVASPEGVAEIRRAVREMPGIVRTQRGPG